LTERKSNDWSAGVDRLGDNLKEFGSGKYMSNTVRSQKVRLTKGLYTREEVKQIIDDLATIHDLDVSVEFINKKESLY
jgi:hypothetical protein